jgi:hypothetical protein
LSLVFKIAGCFYRIKVLSNFGDENEDYSSVRESSENIVEKFYCWLTGFTPSPTPTPTTTLFLKSFSSIK